MLKSEKPIAAITAYELSYAEAESLATHVDEIENPLESAEAYCARFQERYPNFPSAVIRQWFYEHRQAIHQNSWLRYSTLHFERKLLPFADLLADCLRTNPIVDQYQKHFETNNTSQRMSQLAQYIEEKGTWPVAPILLNNPNADIIAPWGMKCDCPLHLLEGHHRFAVLFAFGRNNAVLENHEVWLAHVKVS